MHSASSTAMRPMVALLTTTASPPLENSSTLPSGNGDGMS